MITRTLRMFLVAATASLSIAAVGCAADTEDSVQPGDEQASTASASRVEIWKSEKNDKFYFHVVAGNGRILLQSQGYTAKASAVKGAESALKNINEGNLTSKLAKNGDFYFKVVAGNNKDVGVSQLYTTEAARDSAIKTLQKVGKAITNVAANSEVASRKGGVFEVFEGNDGQFYFHLVAKNGEIVLQSQGYRTKDGAQKGLESVQANGTSEKNIDIVEANDGGFFFHVKAQNGEIVGRGQVFVSAANAGRGRATLIRILEKKEQFSFKDLDAPAAVCGDFGKRFDACLGEHAEGCIDIFDGDITKCCTGVTGEPATCQDIRDHMGG